MQPTAAVVPPPEDSPTEYTVPPDKQTVYSSMAAKTEYQQMNSDELLPPVFYKDGARESTKLNPAKDLHINYDELFFEASTLLEKI
jgi:hypothetical protein